MDQNKKMTSLMLGVGVLATAAFAAQQTNDAQAATRKVTYTSGATTVWTSPTTGQKVKSYLAPNQTVNFVSAKKVYGTNWLQTTDGGWVAEKYLSAETTNEGATSNTTSNTGSTSTGTTATPAAGTIKVTYTGGATTVWNNTGFAGVKGYLTAGQTVSYTTKSVVGGSTWYKLSTGGWVFGGYVSAGDATSTPTAPSTPTVTAPTAPTTPAVTAPAGTLTVTYTAGSTTVWNSTSFSGVKGYLTAGQKVSYTTSKSVGGVTWYQLSNGGWVPGTYVTTGTAGTTTGSNSSSNATGSNTTTNTNTSNNTTISVNNLGNTGIGTKIANEASKYIGVPYLWGGTTPAGFDCSGLIYYAASKVGLNLGSAHRTAANMSLLGSFVSIANIQPGDLLFWGAVGKAYHVGIYVGNGRYIHSPQPGESVKYDTVRTPSFARRL